MLMTLRTWRVQRRDHAEFARISEDEYWPEFDRLDGRALGMWAIRVGGPERLMIMTHYESLEHWLGTRAWGASAGRLKALAERRDRLFDDTDLIAMLALSRRQPAADAPEAQPGIYILEKFHAKLDDMEHFRELTEDVWASWAEAEGGVRLVGMWRSYIGPQEHVHVLTRADSFGAWEARHANTIPCARAGGARGDVGARQRAAALPDQPPPSVSRPPGPTTF